jgi:Protein of unknown function (DUF3617)
MKTRAAERILLLALLAGSLPGAALAAGEIRGGKWQFTTEMQLPATPRSAPGVQPPPASNQPMTRTACIDPAHPIPAEQQCTLDNMKRRGNSVTWAMTCDSPQGPIRSTGSGHYAGDTMEARLTAQVPGPNGKPVNAPGRITGRYLGSCEPR